MKPDESLYTFADNTRVTGLSTSQQRAFDRERAVPRWVLDWS